MVAAAEALSLLLTLLIPGGQAASQKVAGLLHHSVELYQPGLSLLVLDVSWQFVIQNKTTKIVMHHKDQLSIYNPQFTDRVEVSHKGTNLHIKNLRMEDTGVYTAVITFTDHEIRHVSYDLTVYEPVPSPAVRSEVTDDSPGRCNVTLHCSVPSNTSDFSYTWIYRRQDSEYQDMDSTGSSIQISLPPDHQDMDITCIVHNPADQKNISITVTSCFSTDQPLHLYVLLSLLILIPVVGIGTYTLWKIRRKKTNGRGELEHCMPENLSTEPSTSSNQFLPYDQTPHGSNVPTQKFETLYTWLESKT